MLGRFGVLAPLPPYVQALLSLSTLEGRVWVAAAHRVVMDTLRVRLGLICGLTLLSGHHFPSLSIVDELNFIGTLMKMTQITLCENLGYPSRQDVAILPTQDYLLCPT